MTTDAGRRARAREAIGSAVQYGLLFGFAAVAAAISAHGLVGFARVNMGLPGPWPYLLWGALDGAAGLCAVVLMRRAARGEPAVAPRLAVWGLVAASSLFNWTHAPAHPGAREAFALMPVIAATLFEFSLRETRHTAQHAERILPGLAWLRPVERVRVRMHLAADGKVAAEVATRRVRVESAARRLHVLRQALTAQPAARPRPVAVRRVHRAERRAQAALSRAHFAGPAVAVEVLDATLLAGYEEWQDRGRQVRKRQPGIQLIAEPCPGPADGTPTRGTAHAARDAGQRGGGAPRLTRMWNVSQTSGPAVLNRKSLPLAAGGAAPAGLWDALTWLARREGFTVERADCVLGDSQTRWGVHRIRVRPGLGTEAAARALLHELGHVLAHASLAHPPDVGTAGCRGARKIEADSIACAVAGHLGMDTAIYMWPYVASWAGSDPRARPEDTIRSAGDHITQAAGIAVTHLDAALYGTAGQQAPGVRPDVLVSGTRERSVTARRPVTDGAPPAAVLSKVLLDAERFYRARLGGSWVPGYLAARGLGPATAGQWRIGYAPGGWTTLTSHLRRLGHGDAAVEAAGLARRSSRGTLIDHFRDRVMLAIRDERGTITGFVGRARPDTGPGVPKYLNSPETALYTKGDLLFGLHEAREQLACGAMPVIVEGPFDAIAVSEAGAGRCVGLAPCGTALTARQVMALAGIADLDQAGVLVALDGDCAGRDGIVKAYEILLAHAGKLTRAILPTGRDPADILQADGLTALCDAFQRSEPLAQVVIDAHLDRWGRQLDHVEGQLAAMRGAAGLIASTLPPAAAEAIRRVTGGRSLAVLDENLRPAVNPELPEIAGHLDAGAICQIVRVADRTGCEHSEVIAEIANVVTQMPMSPRSPPQAVSRKVTARSPPRHLRVRATGSL